MFGFRWSLYIVQNKNEILYAMHGNSVRAILGYVMGSFEDGARPVEPWSLYLNFNHIHQGIELKPEHFEADGTGTNLSPLLIQQIQLIDPGWRVRGAEPRFEHAATRKSLKISDYVVGNIDIQSMIDNIDKPRETTFFSVMDQVFGRN
jgi:hypothetical protein